MSDGNKRDPWEDQAEGLSADGLGFGPTGPLVTRYSDVTARKVQWLWPRRLPQGKLVLLDGDPDVGKSTVTMDMAGRFTTGSPLPDGYLPPCPLNVLILRGEDGAADTVKPRLQAAGGDPERFLELEGIPYLTDANKVDHRPPELPTDLWALGQVIREYDVALVIVDPLMAFMADHIHTNHDQSVRRALSPMAALAQATGACVVAVRHLNKTVGAPTLYRGGGSIGLLAAARLVMVAGHDPDNEGRRLLAVYKSNLAPKPPTLCYRIVPHEGYACGQVAWEGTSARSGADLLHLSYVDEDERAEVDEGVIFLFQVLAAGPVGAGEVARQARQVGVSDRALSKSARQAGVLKEPAKNGKGWTWRLQDPPGLFDEGTAPGA